MCGSRRSARELPADWNAGMSRLIVASNLANGRKPAQGRARAAVTIACTDPLVTRSVALRWPRSAHL